MGQYFFFKKRWRGLRNVGFNIQNFFYFQHKSHSLTQFNTELQECSVLLSDTFRMCWMSPPVHSLMSNEDYVAGFFTIGSLQILDAQVELKEECTSGMLLMLFCL